MKNHPPKLALRHYVAVMFRVQTKSKLDWHLMATSPQDAKVKAEAEFDGWVATKTFIP